MEVIQKKDITVIVDYAHNKLSFESLFSDMRKEYPGRRLISVYGCPGGKAYLRRTDLGEVSGKLADHTILTAEDPNFEDVEQINKEIGEHIYSVGGTYDSIPDREQAIKSAILQAQAGDVIIITGKGEETYQKVNGVYESFEGDIPLSEKYLAQR
jgi:UDP-N-acetylmuramyl tripeptide synthase